MDMQDTLLAGSLPARLRSEEDDRRFVHCNAEELSLDEHGRLSVPQGRYLLPDDARGDLSRLTRIPKPYFEDLDAQLRAANLNGRLKQIVSPEQVLGLILTEETVSRVHTGNLNDVGGAKIVETILDTTPADVGRDDVRAVEYAVNGHVDVSFISQVGTHHTDLAAGYRYRLRLGAGSLARGRIDLCLTATSL